MTNLPLSNIRVIDLTMWWSGTLMAQILASMGAEVIKIESLQRLDPWRGVGSAFATGKKYEKSPLFNSINNDKYGITLNLTNPKGKELFKKLVKIGDVVTENYTPRVMRNFGLAYDVLKEINPKLIMIGLPSQGATGPWKELAGYGHSIEQMAGIPQLTGEPDGPPEMEGSCPSDPIVGINGAFAVFTALLYRQRTGKGQYIDLSQIEAYTSLIGDAVVEYSMNQQVRPRRGNRHPSMAPHGYYRCKGDDLWVGIALASDEEWERFCEVMGNPPWTKEEQFTDKLSRWHHQDELDKLVEEWTAQHEHYEIMNLLQKAGVAAGAVLTSAELLTDPHLKERGVYQTVERAEVGTHPYYIPAAPMRLSNASFGIRKPAPLVGEDNEYILGGLLGLSKEELQSLEEEQVIGATVTEKPTLEA